MYVWLGSYLLHYLFCPRNKVGLKLISLTLGTPNQSQPFPCRVGQKNCKSWLFTENSTQQVIRLVALGNAPKSYFL